MSDKVLIKVRDAAGDLAPIVMDAVRYSMLQNIAKEHPFLRSNRMPNGKLIAEDAEASNFLSAQLAYGEHVAATISRAQAKQIDAYKAQASDDATGMNFLTSQLARIDTKIIERYYVQPRYAKFLPVLTGTGAQFDSVRVFTSDTIGEAREISQKSDVIPFADVKTGVFDMSVSDPIAVGYQWDVLELQQSAYLRKPLDAMRAAAARAMFDRTLNQFALFGRNSSTASMRFPALYNAKITPAMTPGNVVTTGITGAWNTATATQINNDVNLVLAAIHAATGYQDDGFATDLLIAPDRYQYLLNTMSSIATMSILEYIKAHNYSTAVGGVALTISQAPGLENTNAFDPATTLNNHRIIAYTKNPEALEFEVTQQLTWLPPQYEDLNVRIPGFGRCTRGVKFNRPTNYAYAEAC